MYGRSYYCARHTPAATQRRREINCVTFTIFPNKSQGGIDSLDSHLEFLSPCADQEQIPVLATESNRSAVTASHIYFPHWDDEKPVRIQAPKPSSLNPKPRNTISVGKPLKPKP